ncbi:TetR/AcrR family transcriptional regulator [Brevundimonas sp. AAP58]|uniref:TetR/AcrR family transcriptional regulator n=1 Tax=Brevundimonas sp. AAP58 TaxID=1523422 RepID=UPI0009E6AA6B|nr:TetR/AcrR family transcriptional regulator [Brevundimonas sp. AAP58]
MQTPKPKGRRPDQDKADAVLDHGWALFLEHGVQAVSMEMIAAAAGVSKVTAYRHFADKHDLFRAAIRKEMARLETMQGADGPAPDLPVRDALRTFGLGLMTYLFSGPAIDFYTALAGELRRTPDLARAFYDAGPGKTHANLTALLSKAAARGELVVEDVDVAVDHFLGLLQGYSSFQLSLGVEPAPLLASVEPRVEAAVDVFLRAYGAPQ